MKLTKLNLTIALAALLVSSNAAAGGVGSQVGKVAKRAADAVRKSAAEKAGGRKYTLLTLFFNPSRVDFCTAIGPSFDGDVGYRFVRNTCVILTSSQLGARSLRLFWHEGRGDYLTAASPETVVAALRAGYSSRRRLGYVFARQRPNTRALKLFWNSNRRDHLTASSAEDEATARASGYRFVRIEGYVPSNVGIGRPGNAGSAGNAGNAGNAGKTKSPSGEAGRSGGFLGQIARRAAERRAAERETADCPVDPPASNPATGRSRRLVRDIRVLEISGPPLVRKGDLAEVTIDVESTRPSDAFDFEIFVSADHVLDDGDRKIHVGTAIPGKQTVEVQMPQIRKGEYRLILRVPPGRGERLVNDNTATGAPFKMRKKSSS